MDNAVQQLRDAAHDIETDVMYSTSEEYSLADLYRRVDAVSSAVVAVVDELTNIVAEQQRRIAELEAKQNGN